MKTDLRNVLYYETFKNNKELDLYIYDVNKKEQYKKVKIINQNIIRELLKNIDSKMAKIIGVTKKDENVVMSYIEDTGARIDIEFSGIDYENAIKLKDRQNKTKKPKKRMTKTTIFVALVLTAAGAIYHHCPNVKKYLGKDTKDGYTILDSIPTIKPYEEITDISEFTSEEQLTSVVPATPTVVPATPTVVPVKPTVVPTATKEAVVTESPVATKKSEVTINPTIKPQKIEEERKLFEEVATPTPVAGLEDYQKMHNVAIEVSKIDNLGVKQLPLHIFVDPDAAVAANRIIKGNLNFNETAITENDAFKGIVFLESMTSAFVLTDIDGTRLSYYAPSPTVASELRKIEDMILSYKRGTNNEAELINEAMKIYQNPGDVEIDYIKVGYITSAANKFKKETQHGEFLVKFKENLMHETFGFCFKDGEKVR